MKVKETIRRGAAMGAAAVTGSLLAAPGAALAANKSSGINAQSLLNSFLSTFSGGLQFLGGFMVIGGIITLVVQWRMGEGGGGAAVASGIFLIVAGIIIAIVGVSAGSLDTGWAAGSAA